MTLRIMVLNTLKFPNKVFLDFKPNTAIHLS